MWDVRTPDSCLAGSARPSIRVASVPSDHVYVRHLSPVGTSDGVERLPDPTVPWWPPAMLDAAWVREHSAEFDLMHVHFGFDGLDPGSLSEFADSLRRVQRPLVLTVHDLRNPHHPTRELHDAQLDVLVPAADALVTLTSGAAAEIRRRWGRSVVVVPHPHVVELETLSIHRRERSGDPPFVVGVHLKSARACMAGAPVVDALVEIIKGDDVVLRVNAHTDLASPDGARYDPEVARSLELASRAGADVLVHDFYSDSDLWAYLSALDLSVLPYRFGTHSGWLEACRDLGTAVAAPRCGFYAEQGPVHSFDLDEQGLDPDSLCRAVRAAMSAPLPRPVPMAERLAQREQVAQAHAELYRELVR